MGRVSQLGHTHPTSLDLKYVHSSVSREGSLGKGRGLVREALMSSLGR